MVAPRARVSAWLLPNAKPPLRGERINSTHGNSAATMSAEPSVDALSTTSASAWSGPPDREVEPSATRALMQASRCSQVL